jgi:hypothetical protein
MNKRQIISSLNNIADTLDNSGFNREADTITKVMVKLAEEETESYGKEPAKKIIDDFVDQAKRNERYDASILKMMNDRLEFNGHERMSEKKFKEMIGKNKEANSTGFMKRLAMPSSTENTAEAHQEMSYIMQSINKTTSIFETELSDFNRLLRFMEESLNNRYSDPQDITMLKRKLNQKLVEINDLRIKLSNNIQEMSRVSGIVQQKFNNATEMVEPTTQVTEPAEDPKLTQKRRVRFEN